MRNQCTSEMVNQCLMWVLNNQLIGPYFYDCTLTGQRYIDFLVNILPDLMVDVLVEVCDNIWLQQDGAPPHNANVVKDRLNQQYL